MRIGGGTRGPLRVAAYPSPGSQTRSSSHWAGSRLSIPASRRIMSRSCRRAARLACLTSSCGLGPRSARNRSLALSRAVLAAFRAQVFKAFHLKICVLYSPMAMASSCMLLAPSRPFRRGSGIVNRSVRLRPCVGELLKAFLRLLGRSQRSRPICSCVRCHHIQTASRSYTRALWYQSRVWGPDD